MINIIILWVFYLYMGLDNCKLNILEDSNMYLFKASLLYSSTALVSTLSSFSDLNYYWFSRLLSAWIVNYWDVKLNQRIFFRNDSLLFLSDKQQFILFHDNNYDYRFIIIDHGWPRLHNGFDLSGILDIIPWTDLSNKISNLFKLLKLINKV